MIAALLFLLVSAGPTPAASEVVPDTTAAHAAIVEAVRARIGDAQADVEVIDLVVRSRTATGRLVATPEPDGRLTKPIRFSLSERGTDQVSASIGYAVATVRVSTVHVRVAHTVPRGTVLEPDALAAAHGDVGALTLRRLPTLEDLVGGRAARDLEAGEVVTRPMVIAQPLVRSGDPVIVRTAIGGVQVEGRAIAAQNGFKGETIRVTNPDSRKSIRARVVGAGEVEVVR